VRLRGARAVGVQPPRSRQGDPQAAVIAFLVQHPRSTTGDVAKGLNLSYRSVSTRLTQLANAGEIKKTSHGYNIEQAARPRGPSAHSVTRTKFNVAGVSNEVPEYSQGSVGTGRERMRPVLPKAPSSIAPVVA
jgi:hypothetical protein